MDHRDFVLQASCPTVIKPKFGEFEYLSQPGHRLVIGSDGVILEIARPWLYAAVQVAKFPSDVCIPYGEVLQDCIVRMRIPPIPKVLLEKFQCYAVANGDCEVAAGIVWSGSTGQFHLKTYQAISSDQNHIHYSRPILADDEYLIVDLHSHGFAKAFFSEQDDADDTGEVKISGVIGSLNATNPSWVFRYCLLGKFASIQLAAF